MPPLHNRFIRYQLRRLFNHISTMEAVCIQVYSRPHSRIHCIKRPAHTHNHLCHRLLVYHHMRAANTGDQLRPLHNNINRYLKASFNCSLKKLESHSFGFYIDIDIYFPIFSNLNIDHIRHHMVIRPDGIRRICFSPIFHQNRKGWECWHETNQSPPHCSGKDHSFTYTQLINVTRATTCTLNTEKRKSLCVYDE